MDLNFSLFRNGGWELTKSILKLFLIPNCVKTIISKMFWSRRRGKDKTGHTHNGSLLAYSDPAGEKLLHQGTLPRYTGANPPEAYTGGGAKSHNSYSTNAIKANKICHKQQLTGKNAPNYVFSFFICQNCHKTQKICHKQ